MDLSIPLLPYDTGAHWCADEIDWYRSTTGAERVELVFWFVVRRYGRQLAEKVWPDSAVPQP